jgi:hypothetical protein
MEAHENESAMNPSGTWAPFLDILSGIGTLEIKQRAKSDRYGDHTGNLTYSSMKT